MSVSTRSEIEKLNARLRADWLAWCSSAREYADAAVAAKLVEAWRQGRGRNIHEAWKMEQEHTMKPALVLLREEDTGGPRHGGWRTYRNFSLWLNGVLMRRWRDDCGGSGYAVGPYLDKIIEDEISRFEQALGVRRMNAHSKKGRLG